MISIIIPVYNGENTLRGLYSRIRSELEGKFQFEVIFVLDSGKDKSWEIIKNLAESDSSRISGYSFDRNMGQHYATMFGLKKSAGDYVFTLDEDAQHDPKFIPVMIEKMKSENADLIYGQFSKLEQPFFKVWMSFFLRRILCVMIPYLPREYSAYRLINKTMVNKLIKNENNNFFLDAEFGKVSPNHSSILIEHFKRSNGSTSYTIVKLIRQTLDVLFKYSKIFALVFNTFLSASVILLLFFFYQFILDPNKNSTVFALLLLCSSTLLYIRIRSMRRIFSKRNPVIIDQITNNK